MDTLLPTLPLIPSASMRSVRGVLSMRCAAWAASALIVCALQPALATNGVVDINQTRALAGGITAGDTPGFPITISESGSYRLTSNIDITGVAAPLTTSAIQITAPDVSLDLNGFSVIGPVNCTGAGATISCLPAPGVGTGADLIFANTAALRALVRNGAVRGAGGSGVNLEGTDSSVRDLVSASNFDNGVRLSGGTVDSVRVYKNKRRGVVGFGTEGGMYSRIHTKENGEHGLLCYAPTSSRAYQVVASRNGLTGISTCAVESSQMYFNNGGLDNVQLNGIDVGLNVCYKSGGTTCP